MKTWGMIAAALLVAVLVLGAIATMAPAPASAQNTACYRAVGGDTWVCASGGEMEFRSGSTLDIQSGTTASFGGALTIDGAISGTAGGNSFSGDVTIGDDLKLTAQTGITVTNGAAFAPTGSYQPITAAGEVTPTVTVGAAGDIVVLVNTSAQTINIADTGTAKLSAAAALGQYDSLTLLSDGTNWIEVSRSDN